MKNSTYKNNTNLILNEIRDILSNISIKQTEVLINQIILANRIFLVAIGRVNLSLQCFGKRLSHLGFKVELVWIIN
jgi:DNA-binding MurR/RpiR family transcriptional regulator